MRLINMLVVAVMTLVLVPGTATAHAPTARASGLQPVLTHQGGQILACRSRSSSGFISTLWAVRNTRRSDVVKATVRHRTIDFTGDWTEWHRPFSTTGWINPGSTRNVNKTSSSDTRWSNHQTRVTVVSRATGTRKSRVLSWALVPRC